MPTIKPQGDLQEQSVRNPSIQHRRTGGVNGRPTELLPFSYLSKGDGASIIDRNIGNPFLESMDMAVFPSPESETEPLRFDEVARASECSKPPEATCRKPTR